MMPLLDRVMALISCFSKNKQEKMLFCFEALKNFEMYQKCIPERKKKKQAPILTAWYVQKLC